MHAFVILYKDKIHEKENQRCSYLMFYLPNWHSQTKTRRNKFLYSKRRQTGFIQTSTNLSLHSKPCWWWWQNISGQKTRELVWSEGEGGCARACRLNWGKTTVPRHMRDVPVILMTPPCDADRRPVWTWCTSLSAPGWPENSRTPCLQTSSLALRNGLLIQPVTTDDDSKLWDFPDEIVVHV